MGLEDVLKAGDFSSGRHMDVSRVSIDNKLETKVV